MALTCQAQWDFAYGGHLAGTALKQKDVAPILSEGRAWGAAVAAYHVAQGVEPADAGNAALLALNNSLEEDANRQREFGVFIQKSHDDKALRLKQMLLHYIWEVDDFTLDPMGVERELLTPIPSRTGRRHSNRYVFQGFIDGTKKGDTLRPWLVEFKLRYQLTPVELIQLDRQIRRYSWAWWQVTGIRPIGIEVHERWNEVPKNPRINKATKKHPEGVVSHAKDQLTTADAYLDVCAEYDQEPDDDTVAALKARRWQQVVPIMFRDGELEEAGAELVSAAKLIRDLDSGDFWPIRNAKPQNCRGCRFKSICPSPDNELVDVLFERVPAKRDRSSTDERAST
jgi:hypothetical protein